MPRYRIHRIKETPRENFRWAPHTGGEAVVKLKDYESAGSVEAPSPYAAWKSLGEAGESLHAGDLLEVMPDIPDTETPAAEARPPELLIAKYIGFEPARWFVPETRKLEAHPDLPSFSVEAPAPVLARS